MALPMEEHCTAAEFYALTEGRHCELTDGYISELSSPSLTHQRISARLHAGIVDFIEAQNGKCEALAAFNVELNDRTIFEPDIIVACDPNKLTEKKHIGAPDWVIEIVSPDSVAKDYRRKMTLYHDSGVREYWIIDPRVFVTTVYVWDGDLEATDIYAFAQKIPVYIFKDKTPPLEICVGNYL
ncbi:MAG: Uma2 family endonuclease [Ruminococcus sp.]|nr:Uma2 family endonuclease [Ruminococcus sp.]